MTKALIAAANGCEEIETIATYDLLKRAGIEVTIAAVDESSTTVCASHGLKFLANSTLSVQLTEEYDIIVLPGGLPGAEHLRDCKLLIELLKKQNKAKKWIAAICAAPGFVLGTHGLADGAKVTGYPGTENLLKNGNYVNQVVCVDADKKIITAQGPAFTNAFALAIIANLCGEKVMKQVASGALISH